jgi:hypothetical protein
MPLGYPARMKTGAPLPPLPPVPGVTNADLRPGGATMLAILAAEHARLIDLCRRLSSTMDTPELGSLTSTLVATLSRHLSAEEQYLFPTLAAVLPDGPRLAETEVAADQAMLHALRRLEDGPATDLRGLEEVDPALHLHVKRCEQALFPRLREVLTDAELIRLGNRVLIAKEAAPTRPHPGTPATPPWNKLVDPAVGVVDRLRDVVGRRSTQA